MRPPLRDPCPSCVLSPMLGRSAEDHFSLRNTNLRIRLLSSGDISISRSGFFGFQMGFRFDEQLFVFSFEFRRLHLLQISFSRAFCCRSAPDRADHADRNRHVLVDVAQRIDRADVWNCIILKSPQNMDTSASTPTQMTDMEGRSSFSEPWSIAPTSTYLDGGVRQLFRMRERRQLRRDARRGLWLLRCCASARVRNITPVSAQSELWSEFQIETSCRPAADR